MDDLDGLWKRLSLNEKEDNLFDLSSDTQPDKPTLAAKFYTRRVINVEAIARTFKPLWQTKNGFSIQDVGDNTALIEFEDAADLERVLLGEPWSYDKYLIAFHRLNKAVAVENLPFHQVAFWVQLHNLPVLSMKRKVAIAMGSFIGEVLPSLTQDEETGNGKYMRIRVRVNITKPLCRGRKIGLGNGTESWVSFQYERLPNFCYWCGIPTHGEKDCEDWLRTPENLRERPLEFGSWLRANGERVPRKVQVTVEGHSRRATGSRWNSAAHNKSTPSPPQPHATTPPCADFPATDMEITESVVTEQSKAVFTEANPSSFEDRLHEIDVAINYAPASQGDLLTAGVNSLEPIVSAELCGTNVDHLHPNLSPDLIRASPNDTSNKWATPESQGKAKTGSWKRKARSNGPTSSTAPLILAEKRTSAAAFQATPTEIRLTKTARLFQNELSSAEAGTQPRRDQ
jgi:hypothetical protein